MKAKIFLTGFALVVTFALTSAQNPIAKKGNGTAQGSSYVDANTNGICDNSENRTANATVGKQNRQGKGQGNCDGTRKGQGNKQGKGQGNGLGQGNGKNFVDADNNGVCDNSKKR